MTAEPLPIAITIIPILWAFIGGSSAFLLGVRTDLVMLAAGVGLLTDVLVSRFRNPGPFEPGFHSR
jgi:hypothetical protein